MKDILYDMIFKRKSFHLFRNTAGVLSAEDLEYIHEAFRQCKPLREDIRVEMKLASEDETSCKRGQEYCILLYSEEKEGYLQNIGYIGEQLDLYLASRNIGALWFGIGRVAEQTCQGLQFVIMIAIARMEEGKFRKDMFKSKRKPLEEIWQGEALPQVQEIVRFAPSACNTQPWIVKNKGQKLMVYRYKKAGKRGIMPAEFVSYYNRIDIGIFLLFLELCLEHEGISFARSLCADTGDEEMTLNAVYTLKKSLP